MGSRILLYVCFGPHCVKVSFGVVSNLVVGVFLVPLTSNVLFVKGSQPNLKSICATLIQWPSFLHIRIMNWRRCKRPHPPLKDVYLSRRGVADFYLYCTKIVLKPHTQHCVLLIAFASGIHTVIPRILEKSNKTVSPRACSYKQKSLSTFANSTIHLFRKRCAFAQTNRSNICHRVTRSCNDYKILSTSAALNGCRQERRKIWIK